MDCAAEIRAGESRARDSTSGARRRRKINERHDN